MHGADTTCFYASPSFCNLLPFFFLKAVCNRNSWHYVYTYQASRSKYLDISFNFNLPIWSGRQKKFMITSLFGKCLSIVTIGILQIYIQKTLSKNKLRMLLTFNYFLRKARGIFRLRTSHFEVQTSDFGIVISGFSPSLVLAFSHQAEDTSCFP
jgi:hypothetical protein